MTIRGLLTCLSIWSSKSDPHHHGYPYNLGLLGRGTIHPLMMFTSFSYICLSFLRLDDQMRLPFGPDYCRHYCIFLPGTYQISYPPLIHWHWPLRCVSGRVNVNCSCPCRSHIRVDTNCNYPWTPISLKCWVVFIKAIYTWVSTLFSPHYMLII